MDIDRDKQLQIIAKTNQILSETENKRMLLRFQRGVVDLENGRFGVLLNSEFVEKFIEYLYTIYQKGPEENILKLLEKITSCACNAETELRERAIFILSIFIEKVSKEKNSPEFLESVSRLLVNWLQTETEYLSGFQFICLQLQSLLQKMLRMGLWYQTENLIIVLSQIQKGVIQKNNLIRQTISKVHASLAEETFLKDLVNVFLDKKEDRRDIAQCLLLHFGSKAAAVLVQFLMDCKDKEKRFSLIEFIPETGKVSLPVYDFCLKQNPPWYVIRNLIIVISRMEDPKLYEMVRPYLTHKDIRVQLQVLNCINRLGGPQLRDRLIEALTYINDELKKQVVIQLGNIGGKDVGNAFCALLEKRGELAIHVQDELVLTLCTKIKFTPSEYAIKVMKDLQNERIKRFGEGDRILQAAEDALISMELKNTGNMTAGDFPFAPLTDAPASNAFKVPVVSEEELDDLLNGILPVMDETSERSPIVPRLPQKPIKMAVPKTPPPASSDGLVQEVRQNLDDPSSAIHFAIWEQLYKVMTTEEFTAFHTALSLKTYLPDELIVARGDLQAPLFLFDNGSANLVRTQADEEVYLSAIGAGDLIGSNIFLTGEAWNLSLYAREIVRVRVFDLENLIQLQAAYPHIAEKIFTFCSGRDVLQTLLRVLDDPQCAGTESVPLERVAAQEKTAEDNMPQGMIMQKLRGGLCFTLPVQATEKINALLDNQLQISIRLSTDIVASRPATINGIMRYINKPETAIAFVRFAQPLPDAQYSCEKIEFPK